MMVNLWSENSPQNFWLCETDPPDHIWQEVIQSAATTLELSPHLDSVDNLLASILGEEQFGSDHWRLGLAHRFYYTLKPFLPRRLRTALKQLHSLPAQAEFSLGWPIEGRYVYFLWEVMRRLLLTSDQQSLKYRSLWPEEHHFAFVLTHDVETEEGQAFIRAVVDLEESFGFRSSFNFVPERYPLDYALIEELRWRGFEIGVHGLKHDGMLFSSQGEFTRRTKRINMYLQELDAVGFRSPLTMRNPEWMQALDIKYDLSFFDTDPCEPVPGGTMSIWPFFLGRFVELPYTLMQDCTLTTVLRETTPYLWLQKVDFIDRYFGMVLVNTHPDYLLDPVTWKVYADFLQIMRNRNGYWHSLPREVAKWWHKRKIIPPGQETSEMRIRTVNLDDQKFKLERE